MASGLNDGSTEVFEGCLVETSRDAVRSTRSFKSRFGLVLERVRLIELSKGFNDLFFVVVDNDDTQTLSASSLFCSYNFR